MAVKLSKTKTIEVISHVDDAIDCDSSVYGQYLETLDENLLNLKPGVEPTRFVMRLDIPYDDFKRIQSEMIQVKGDPITGKKNAPTKFDVVVDMTGPRFETVRAALTDIRNPSNVPVDDRVDFKKDTDGLASKELVGLLARAGIVDDLANAHAFASRADATPLAKKN